MAERMKFRIGRRGAVLLLFATLYMVLGLGYIFAAEPRTIASLQVATEMTGGGIAAWGVLWCAISVVGFVTAFWPPGKDHWGFSALSGLAYLWGGVYLMSWVLYNDNDRGWVSGLIFLSFGAALSLIAGWPEPRIDRRPRP